jgi:YfiH family protein
VTAGITGRGGDREAPFDLGLWSGAPVGETMSRWQAFRQSLPAFAGQVMSHQVHGDRVLWHGGGDGWQIHEAADGHATTATGLLLLVTVADCVPVYLLAPRQQAIALLHAGWRGTAAGILRRGVELLSARTGAAAGDLVMHLGVAISGPRYEVGAEVLAGVGRAAAGPGPWTLDLREVLRDQGRDLGIGETTISGHCTARDAGAFFSHRRSGGRDGRLVAYLGMPGRGE